MVDYWVRDGDANVTGPYRLSDARKKAREWVTEWDRDPDDVAILAEVENFGDSLVLGGVVASEGTRVRAGTTGQQYRIESVDDSHVRLHGPNGPITVAREEFRADVEAGRITVLD